MNLFLYLNWNKNSLLPDLISGVYSLLIINFNILDTVSTQFSSSYFLNNKH